MQTNGKIKKLSDHLSFGMIKISPAGSTIPTFIVCFANYLTTDLGTDAFELPIAGMW